MKLKNIAMRGVVVVSSVFFWAQPAWSTDKALLDILLGNGVITQQQYEQLLGDDDTSSDAVAEAAVPAESNMVNTTEPVLQEDDGNVTKTSSLPTPAGDPDLYATGRYTSSGFRFETADQNWQTNLQWRAQFRYSNPTNSDPR